MPFKSKAQMRFFMANRDKLGKQGVNVDEWLSATKNIKKLPEHVGDKVKKTKPKTYFQKAMGIIKKEYGR